MTAICNVEWWRGSRLGVCQLPARHTGPHMHGINPGSNGVAAWEQSEETPHDAP